MHGSNLIFRKHDKKLFFIDFDYSCYNYRGYDIANFFNEFSFDYSHKEPPFYTYKEPNEATHKAKRQFLRYYLVFSSTDLSNIESID